MYYFCLKELGCFRTSQVSGFERGLRGLGELLKDRGASPPVSDIRFSLVEGNPFHVPVGTVCGFSFSGIIV